MKKIPPACLICSKPGDIHHVYTRKAYPELRDEEFNHMPLCREHHVHIHQLGLAHMANAHFYVKLFLINHGWSFDKTKNKWCPKTYQAQKKEEI